MPLSEFLKIANETLGSDQQKMASTTDLSSFHENELVELVWENGQIMMQGQSSRTKKSPSFSNLPSNAPSNRDKYIGNSSRKIEKSGVMNSILNDMSLSVPTCEMDLSQEEYVVPWLSYKTDGSLQQDYFSQLMPDISGMTANEPSKQMTGGSHSVPIHNVENLEQRSASKVSPNSRFNLLHSCSPQKGHASVPSLGSGVSNVVNSNTINNPVSVFGNSNQSQASDGGIKSMTIQKQNMTSSDSGLFNFAHFSRPATFLKGNCNGESGVSGSSTIEVKGNKDRENVAGCSNPVSPVPVEPHFGSKKEDDLHLQAKTVSSKVDSRTSLPCHIDRSHAVEHNDNMYIDDTNNNDKSADQGTGENATKEYPAGKRNVEPPVACSSVCSASSAERVSSDYPHNRKRKSYDNEDSGFRSEDVEEESFGVKRARPVGRSAGSKRGRAAEVHNLSERRRRDRINEKMRALQELVPNCNKTDKASMLDEAIEYLKTLQLQIQIMSMGAGLGVPPMMFPMGMQHMPGNHMSHFSPMGLRMGMGYGMGMLENGGLPGCPILPMPTLQGAQFPSPPVSGSAIFPGIAGYNLHAFGHPGQGLPMSAAQAPSVPLAGQPSTSSAVGLNVPKPGVHVDKPSQVQATTETQDRSATVRTNDRLPEVSDSAANNLTVQTDVPGSSKASEFV